MLREEAVTPNTKRTQRVRGCGSEPRNDLLAGAETVFMVERNMVITSRRREVLTFSHHREVAALPVKQQDK